MAKNNQAIVCDERLRHIGFIMDGNGRWAKKRGLARSAGHVAGALAFKKLVTYCNQIGLEHMTVYAFSTENWARPAEEVEKIMVLLSDYIDEAQTMFRDNDTRIIFLGDKSPFPEKLKQKMLDIEKESEGGRHILNIAMNYGSRAEIVNAVNSALKSGKESITEQDIDSNLYTVDSPPLDLVIRTAGEKRLSNFLLWQAAYAEFYFTDTLWPDFGEKDLNDAIEDFYSRHRKFGGLC